MSSKNLRVAIVHDWLIGGGAEKVVAALHKMYPEAPIYTSYCSDEWRTRLNNKVITGFLQNWPFSKLRKFLPVLRIWWFTHLNFSGYDLVISSSGNGEAFGIHTPKNTLHVNYCHTPTHYYWRHYNLYLKQPGFGIFNPLARLGLRLLVGPLKKWDLAASKRPDYYISNSTHIQKDIKKYYGRTATVIYPPVDTQRFNIVQPKLRSGFVIAGRQVPQKKFDLAIMACNKLGLPLTVLGKGPEHKNLLAIAGPTIKFVENVSDTEMPKLIASAKGFIFPCQDDFGIIPIEAMAAGTPVIAYNAGGALDYVINGKTGVFFGEQTVASLSTTLQNFNPENFDHKYIKHHATNFSEETFIHNMQNFVDKALTRR